jgi:hypothetical protein
MIYARDNLRVQCVTPARARAPLTQPLPRNEPSLKLSAA